MKTCSRILLLVALASPVAACTFGKVGAESDAAELPDGQGPDSSAPDGPGGDGPIEPPLDAGPMDAPFDGIPDGGEVHPIGDLIPGVATLVGHSLPGLVDGPRDQSLFRNPVNVIAHPEGGVLVADFDNGAIRRITEEGFTTTLTHQPGFRRPFGMVFTQDGALIVQTDFNSTGQLTGAIWNVDLESGEATLRLDNAGRLRAMVLRSDGQIVTANFETHVLQVFDPETNEFAPYVGATGESGYVDGTGAAARFHRPLGLAIDAADNVFVSDSFNHRIRLVTPQGTVTTLAGSGQDASVDGTAFGASIASPAGIIMGPNETLYVCEFTGGKIRRIRSGRVLTVAGGERGFADNEDPLQARFNICEGLTISGEFMYSSDGNGGTGEDFHRVRRISLSAI